MRSGTSLQAAFGLPCAVALLTVSGHAQSPSWVHTAFATTAQTAPRAPTIHVDAGDAVHILFFVDSVSGGRGRVHYIRWSSSAGWSTPEFVTDNAAHVTSLAVNQRGDVFASYATSTPTEAECIFWRAAVGGTWSPLTCLPTGGHWMGGMGGKVLLDASGWPALAYFSGPGEDALYASWNGNGWTVETIAGPNRVGKAMHAVLLPHGNPAVAYYDQDADCTVFAERVASGTWSVEYMIGGPSAGHQVGDPVDLAVTSTGEVLLLRRATDLGPVYLHRRTSGGWILDATFPASAYEYARIASGPTNVPHVVGTDRSGRLDYLSASTTGTWVVSPMASGPNGGYLADLAIQSNGDPVTVYTRIADYAQVLVRPAIPEYFCSPDGLTLQCPCGNTGIAGVRGCDNSPGTGGAAMHASGNSSVSADTLRLTCDGLPPSAIVLFFQGSSRIQNTLGGGIGFGDGVRCITGIQRLGIRNASAGVASFGHGATGSPSVSQAGAVLPGQELHYQVWYRDPSPYFCSPATFNLSNGVTIRW